MANVTADGSDGKSLEGLVSLIERLLLPQGFDVTVNHRVFNDEGVQIAEFDVLVEGKVGSTDFSWLIECRDRPGSGPAPSSWIEQLVGRRDRFGFHKVTAVSSTGFAAGAITYAEEAGIELRSVLDVEAEDIASWMPLTHIQLNHRHSVLTGAVFLLPADESEDRRAAVLARLPSFNGETKFLRSTKTGEHVSPAQAFTGALGIGPSPFDSMPADGSRRPVHLNVAYANADDRFVIDLGDGELPAHVAQIEFQGEIWVVSEQVPVGSRQAYMHTPSSEGIANSVAFPFAHETAHGAVEFHQVTETGQTHVVLRLEMRTG